MSVLKPKVCLALLLSLLLASAVCAATDPWDGPAFSAEAKSVAAAASAVTAGDKDVVILLDETKYEIDGTGRSVRTRRQIYRIAAESAIDYWSTVDERWVPWMEERPSIDARVITKDGVEHRLDQHTIVETPGADNSNEMFTDDRILKAPLPAVAVGSVVEEVTTHRDTKALFDAGTTGVVLFGSYVPARRIRLIIDAPANMEIRIGNETTPRLEPLRETAGDRQTIRFEGGPYEGLDHFEWNLPYDVSPLPYVAFSSGKSWQEIAKRYGEIVDAQIAQTPADKLPKEVLEKSGDKQQVINRALAYVQTNIRYAGMELGESSIVPRTPGAVLSTRYGDCKDKATLLIAILRAAGIDAHLALVRSGTDLDIRKDLPGFGRFNHAVVRVGGPQPMWIDPTAEFFRAGDLPVGDQGRLALVARPDTTELALTPSSESRQNRTVETRTVTLVEEGKAPVVEVTESSGDPEASQRGYYARTERKQYREGLEEYARNHYHATALKSFEASDPHDLKTPFRLKLEITEAGRAVTEDGEAVVAVFPSMLTSDLPEDLQNGPPVGDEAKAKKEKRINDFVFTPFVKEWRYQIVPPPGYGARTLPQNETIPLGTTTLVQEFAMNAAGTVSATFRFDSGKARLTVAEFEATRKAISEYGDRPAVAIGFEQTATRMLNSGDVAGALTEYRALAKLHPKEARHQMEIAHALLVGGMGEAARQQIAKAIALEPKYAGAYREQGWILQHDLLGRRFRTGCDIKGSIAAYGKAKELDPKSALIRVDLARVLQYGEDGLPFGTNAHVSEAVAEYKAIKDDLNLDGYRTEYLNALAHAGQFQVMREVAAKATESGDRQYGMLVATAATEGADAAVRVARTWDAADRKEALRKTATMMLALRKYEVATVLLDEANSGSATATTRAQLDVLRRARRYDETQLAPDDPKSVVKRFQAFAVGYNPGPKELASYFTTAVRPFIEKQMAEKRATWFQVSRGVLARVAREQGLPLMFYIDVGLSSAQFTQEGNDETGYRIRMQSSAAGVSETYFVVREEGQYRIGAFDKVPGLTGLTALLLLEQGKPEAARQWLNWQREEMTPANTDDPLSGSPFTALWQRETQTATPEAIKLAAASLMLSKDYSDRALPILTASRETANGDARLHIDQAIALAHLGKEQYDELLKVSTTLYASAPRSLSAFALKLQAFTRLGRYADASQLANERLKLFPSDRTAFSAIGMAAMMSGDYPTADRTFRKIIDEMSPTPLEYNNLAWNALLAGTGLDEAIEQARRGLPQNGEPSSALLHTLAALYAETGKSVDARDALWLSMDTVGRDEPRPDDWYVLGRIAESYGATDAAAAGYHKPEKPKVPDQASTYVLAQRALKRLNVK